jgi:hypothetical protein
MMDRRPTSPDQPHGRNGEHSALPATTKPVPWRPVPGEPWLWQPKAALRKIVEQLEGDAATALAVYMALTWIASDVRSATFSRSRASIGHLAGVTVKTVTRRLDDLRRLGLVKVTAQRLPGRKAQDVSRYHLGTLSPNPPVDIKSLGTARGPHAVPGIKKVKREELPSGSYHSAARSGHGRRKFQQRRPAPKNLREVTNYFATFENTDAAEVWPLHFWRRNKGRWDLLRDWHDDAARYNDACEAKSQPDRKLLRREQSEPQGQTRTR